ncbi:hypothetical protein WOLCODRAFT_136303 [Wolfiporia cocos MD-104 SS10]|uniref:EI24-domain-containing protein n=1 Tax=Wolfiporia cocos (strain MD-104) TaxID=742152 RepID=A0A2H3JR43_WOLCO|nr:hypothetical protein WOLCODRAFT_136303 [Wolfiporia cocos MD-104 SS10]
MTTHGHPRRPVHPYESPAQASRATYPTFLPLHETLRVQLACAGRGLVDAFRWDTVVRLVASDPEIRANVLKCLLLNTLALASIYVFDLLLFPLAQGEHHWLHRNVGWAYQVLWLLPVVGISLYLNSTWCSIIAKRTFALQHGPRAGAAPPATYSGLLNALATSAYGGIMVVTSVVISFALARVPRIGPPTGFVFLCWVDAYYCFEHVWTSRGLSLARRVRHLEERWAYYFAFGLPTAALCTWGSSLANAALFALVFPAYIIMAMHARPVPLDPYNPLASSSHGDSDEIRHPSPLVPIRLPVFAPVLWLNDWVVRALSFGSGGVVSSSTSGRGWGQSRAGHRRGISEATENIEEGEAVELNPVGVESSPSMPGSGRTRIRVGGPAPNASGGFSRRKLD